MKDGTTDFLTAGELANFGNDVGDLMDDTQISRALTYRDFQSRTRVPSTGAYTAVYADLALRGVRAELSAREIAASDGLYKRGDVRFVLAQSDLGVIPNREDRLVDGTDTFELLTWVADALALMWDIVAREVSA